MRNIQLKLQVQFEFGAQIVATIEAPRSSTRSQTLKAQNNSMEFLSHKPFDNYTFREMQYRRRSFMEIQSVVHSLFFHLEPAFNRR